jgi:hypothetical protein
MGFFSKVVGSVFGGGDKSRGPDPSSLVRQQQLMERFNIVSPEGGRTFTTDPKTGRQVLTIEETPFQQEQRGRRQELASTFLESLAGGPERFGAETKRIGDVTFERGLSRLEPFIERRRRRAEVGLATQGLPLGSEARTEALGELSRSETDLLTALAQESELSAGREQSRLRELAGREAGFFAGDIGGINIAPFAQVARVDPAGIRQRAEQARLGEMQVGQQRAGMGLDFLTKGVGLAAGLLSDRRAKEDIELVGKENGYNIYEFNYKGKEGRYRGVMAQEVEKIKPEAVIEVNGVKTVNYDMIGVNMVKLEAAA